MMSKSVYYAKPQFYNECCDIKPNNIKENWRKEKKKKKRKKENLMFLCIEYINCFVVEQVT